MEVLAIRENKRRISLLFFIIVFSCLLNAQEKKNDYENKLIAATTFYQRGQVLKAEKELKKLTRKYPEKAAPYYLLSEIYARTGRVGLYEQYAEKAYIRDTANSEYLSNLIAAYDRTGNTLLLKKYLLKAIPSRKEIDYKILLALTDFRAFNETATIRQLDELENQYPDNELLNIIKYKVFTYVQKHDKAKEEAEKLIRKNPDEVQYHLAYLNTLQILKDTVAFLHELDVIDSLDHSMDNTWQYRTEYVIDRKDSLQIREYLLSIIRNNRLDSLRKWQIIGVVTSKVKNNGFFNEELFDWIQHNTPSKKYLKYLVLYNYYSNEKKEEEAITYLKQYLFEVKKDYQGWSTFLQYYLDRLFPDRCLSYCDTAEMYGNKFVADYYRIMSYYQMKQYKKLYEVVKSSDIEKYTNNEFKVFLYNVLALSFYEEKNIKKAFTYYEKIIAIDSTDLLALNNYAYFLSLQNKQLERAERMSRKTIEAEPYNSTYLDTYAWILYKMKDYAGARYYIEEAIRNSAKDNAEIIEHYGDILFVTGDVENAVKAWKLSHELEPSEGKLKKIRKHTPENK